MPGPKPEPAFQHSSFTRQGMTVTTDPAGIDMENSSKTPLNDRIICHILYNYMIILVFHAKYVKDKVIGSRQGPGWFTAIYNAKTQLVYG